MHREAVTKIQIRMPHISTVHLSMLSPSPCLLGYYMIADTSREVLRLGDVTLLTSPVRNSAPYPECVEFWYYMNGYRPGKG